MRVNFLSVDLARCDAQVPPTILGGLDLHLLTRTLVYGEVIRYPLIRQKRRMECR